MDSRRCWFGHGLTRTAFLGRGVIVAGAALAGSSAMPAASNADVGDHHRAFPSLVRFRTRGWRNPSPTSPPARTRDSWPIIASEAMNSRY
jgi:hypothetical protein